MKLAGVYANTFNLYISSNRGAKMYCILCILLNWCRKYYFLIALMTSRTSRSMPRMFEDIVCPRDVIFVSDISVPIDCIYT